MAEKRNVLLENRPENAAVTVTHTNLALRYFRYRHPSPLAGGKGGIGRVIAAARRPDSWVGEGVRRVGPSLCSLALFHADPRLSPALFCTRNVDDIRVGDVLAS